MPSYVAGAAKADRKRTRRISGDRDAGGGTGAIEWKFKNQSKETLRVKMRKFKTDVIFV